MSQDTIHSDTELRKLRPAELYTLGQILNVSDSWKKLMAIIPKEDNSTLPKFNIEHFSMIEQAAQQQKRNAAEIFLSEWGTMGKNRPTLRILLNLLVKAELFRAADYLAGNVLKEELPKRPKCGPAAPVDISDEVIKKLLEEKQEFEKFETFYFNDVDDNKAMNPNVIDNVINNNSLERNMQSTKLISSKDKHNKKDLENIDNILKSQISNLMKFSSEENIRGYRELGQAFEQEVSASELPVFLNEFERTMEQMKLNQEVLSEELPIFLNNSMIISNKDLSNDQVNTSFHKSSLSNPDTHKNEIISTELPQCIIELHENNSHIAQNALSSQELPITVLEYNK